MIFFYTGTGDLINKTPPVVYQGSSKANTIYFVCPTSPKNLINVAFKLPNGESTPQALMTLTEDTGLTGIFDVKGNIFALWKYDIPSAVTAYKGNVTVQFYISSFDEVLATETATITVQKGVSNIEPEYGDTYQELINFLVSLSSEIADLQDKELNIENVTYEIEAENGNIVIVNTKSIATKKDKDKNTGDGRFGAMIGSGNIMNTDNSFIAGISNESGPDSNGRRTTVFIVGGNSNKVLGQLASAIGHKLNINTEYSNGKPKIGLGWFNQDANDAVVIVGNGTSEEDRKNALVIYHDGHGELQEQGTTDNSIIIKKKLDEVINGTITVMLSNLGLTSNVGGINVLQKGAGNVVGENNYNFGLDNVMVTGATPVKGVGLLGIGLKNTNTANGQQCLGKYNKQLGIAILNIGSGSGDNEGDRKSPFVVVDKSASEMKTNYQTLLDGYATTFVSNDGRVFVKTPVYNENPATKQYVDNKIRRHTYHFAFNYNGNTYNCWGSFLDTQTTSYSKDAFFQKANILSLSATAFNSTKMLSVCFNSTNSIMALGDNGTETISVGNITWDNDRVSTI